MSYVGGEPTGGPHFKAFSLEDETLISVFVGDSSFTGGLYVG